MSTDPISVPQQGFIRSLLSERNPDEHTRREAEGILVAGNKGEAKGIIDRLLNAPRVERSSINGERQEPIVVAPGRYALPSDYDPEGTPVFYKVDHGKAGGRWEGFVFLSKLVGPNESRVRDRVERNRILTLIAQDTMGALRRYGHLAGCCGNCGLELTDKFSRFIGVGPVCREKLGLAKSEAAFVADGGVLPESYRREVAAEEEAASPGPVIMYDRSDGLPAGSPGSRHPFTPGELAEMNERSTGQRTGAAGGIYGPDGYMIAGAVDALDR